MRFLPLAIVVALAIVLAMAAPGCADRACFEWSKSEGACPSEMDAPNFFGTCTDIARVTSPPEFLSDGGLCCYHVVKTADDALPLKCGGVGGGNLGDGMVSGRAVTTAVGMHDTTAVGGTFGDGGSGTTESSTPGDGGSSMTPSGSGSGSSSPTLGAGGDSASGSGGMGGSSQAACATCADALDAGTENVCSGAATSALAALISCACSSACNASCPDFCALGDPPDATCSGCFTASCSGAAASCEAN